jgi:hypothetical protein
VPRSVIVLSEDPQLSANLRAWLRDDSRFIETVAGLHCDGTAAPSTNIYPVEIPNVEWEDWDAERTGVMDPQAMTALIFECRSAVWIAEVGALIAASADKPVWFVDSANVAWPVDRVDPKQLALA